MAAVEGMAIMEIPPFDKAAPRTKSTWPPVPLNCFKPNVSEATWPIKSTSMQELMETILSF